MHAHDLGSYKKHSSSDAATAFSWSVNLGTVNLNNEYQYYTVPPYSHAGRPLQDYHTCFLSLQYDEHFELQSSTFYMVHGTKEII